MLKYFAVFFITFIISGCTITSSVAHCKCTESGECGCKKPCQCKQPCKCKHNHKNNQNDNPYMVIMDSMMIEMDEADKDKRCTSTNFLASMIPHHQAAIDMANYQIKNGKDKDMIALAHQIITEQQTEIAQMQYLLNNYKSCSKSDIITSQYTSQMANSMNVMMNNMPDLKNENSDRGFALSMIPHHQAAIDMAMALINNSQNPQLKSFAENIIATQQVEINRMNLFIKKKD